MQPNTQQVGGIISAAVYSIWNWFTNLSIIASVNPEIELVKSAIIGATVGFIVTTILKYVWQAIRHYWKKYGK